MRTKRSSSDSMTFSGIKSSPFDGLVWRLTVALAHCFHILGGVKPVAHLIHEFMLEIRHRWVGVVYLIENNLTELGLNRFVDKSVMLHMLTENISA